MTGNPDKSRDLPNLSPEDVDSVDKYSEKTDECVRTGKKHRIAQNPMLFERFVTV